ncbi:MAG: hypothetical protein JW863_13375 [Chitinispirillaceae bacterium]|nr:hypothetical protein [Chitinispirillaceae bacterium]
MDTTIEALHNVSCFVGALASACERNLGQGSLSICALAGKKFGAAVMNDAPDEADPIAAIRLLGDALARKGIVWEFEPFSGSSSEAITTDGTKQKIRLVFHTCMVRNALFRYGHEQKLSLCYMSHGVFAGALEKILKGKKASLEIVHAGPNACLKELVLEDLE